MTMNPQQNSRNPSHVVGVTSTSNPKPAGGPSQATGEGIPAGSLYPAYLREWPNRGASAMQNSGPGGSDVNDTTLPAFNKNVRNTGRI